MIDILILIWKSTHWQRRSMGTWKRNYHIPRTTLTLPASRLFSEMWEGEERGNVEVKFRIQSCVSAGSSFLLLSFLSPRRACLQANRVREFKDENCAGVFKKFQWCVIYSNFSWTILSKGERCNEVNPMWSTNLWDKAKPQQQELRNLQLSENESSYPKGGFLHVLVAGGKGTTMYM